MASVERHNPDVEKLESAKDERTGKLAQLFGFK